MILNRFKDCTAVICYNDLVAVKLVELLKRNGILIAQDMSIVSFDNSSLAKSSLYSLTSSVYPSYAIGELAAKSVLEKLDNPNKEIKYQLATKVKIRNSVKKLK
ncbi:MAG: substrate-binding domain-containing protein, partial [Oscillospiraceae bacterium]